MMVLNFSKLKILLHLGEARKKVHKSAKSSTYHGALPSYNTAIGLKKSDRA